MKLRIFSYFDDGLELDARHVILQIWTSKSEIKKIIQYLSGLSFLLKLLKTSVNINGFGAQLMGKYISDVIILDQRRDSTLTCQINVPLRILKFSKKILKIDQLLIEKSYSL